MCRTHDWECAAVITANRTDSVTGSLTPGRHQIECWTLGKAYTDQTLCH
jgi:hypothetical protein